MLELILRFLPVTEPAYAQPVDASMPYRHFRPNRDITYSKDWRFSIVARKHINNYGFASDIDFEQSDARPLLTIIGDSFVEAWQVPNAQTVQGLLAAKVAGNGRVYGIGFSGSPLSQYLAYAEMAHKDFPSDGMVFVIAGNDFDESLLKYKQDAGYHYFAEHNGTLSLERIDHPGQSWAVALASRSSLVMYIRHTVGFNIGQVTSTFLNRKKPPDRFVGNVAAQATPERIVDSKAVIAAFLAELPARSGLRPENILFIVDAMRPQLYNPGELAKAGDSYFGRIRQHFMEQARLAGFEVIDMTKAFSAAYARDGHRFEFPTDNHWNVHAHSIVADQITASGVFKKVMN